MQLFKKKLMCALGEHFRRYAHALRFAVGLHGTQKFHPLLNINTTKFQVEREPVYSISLNNMFE